MQKKKWLTIILSVVLFISIGILGFANVYRIDEVSVHRTTISEEAKEDAVRLQERLDEVYVGGNTLFVDQEAADIVLKDFPYFRITAFKKDFPNRIVVDVKEDEEMFAVQDGGKYHILSAEGVYLSCRDSVVGRSVRPNIVVTGLTVNVALGQVISADVLTTGFVEAVKAMAAAEGMGGSLRGNVTRIEVVVPASGVRFLTFTMREGVQATIYDFASRAQEKAQKLVEKYLQLEDNQKDAGMITVGEAEGNILADYQA